VESAEKIFRVNIALDRELADVYEVTGNTHPDHVLNGAVVVREEGPSPDVSNLLAVVEPTIRVMKGVWTMQSKIKPRRSYCSMTSVGM